MEWPNPALLNLIIISYFEDVRFSSSFREWPLQIKIDSDVGSKTDWDYHSSKGGGETIKRLNKHANFRRKMYFHAGAYLELKITRRKRDKFYSCGKVDIWLSLPVGEIISRR